MRLLSGDIGGTHTRLALARLGDAGVTLERGIKTVNQGKSGPEEEIASLLDQADPVDACCLAVAGPTDGRVARFTNLEWTLDVEALARRFGMPFRLVNDFAAVGWGLNGLREEDCAVLQAGAANPDAPRAALGAGTGLGVSLCVRQGNLHEPLDSEGGHIGFAPASEEQDRLLVFLRREHGGRVSLERLLSGPGLISLYRYTLAEAGRKDAPAFADPHPARAISQVGLSGEDAEAVRALRLFVRIYGQAAGDVALAARAAAGVWLAGGIAPQLLELLRGGEFLAGFHEKGRFSEWMRSVPVRVILDPDVGLKGAAVAASRLVG